MKDVQDRDHILIMVQCISENMARAGHAFLVGAGYAAGMAGCEIAERSACCSNTLRELRRRVGIIGGNVSDLSP